MAKISSQFQQQMQALIGEAETAHLIDALEGVAPVSIRLNPCKPGATFTDTTPVPWCDRGLYLPQRPAFTQNPHLHGGAFYVQEASSMFIEQAFRAMAFSPQRVLDLCAAPGGKSTLWRSLMDDGALLVANEPMRQRAQILAENLSKWGHPDVVVTSAFPHEFASLKGFFDVVATDVPCSGEGMFRKDEGAVEQWSPECVEMCAARSWEIIEQIWDTLREGGYFVYSTCTYNRSEDEDNVHRICQELGAELVKIDVPQEWHIVGDTTGRDLPVYHFFPHKTQGEGFFLALLRKTSPSASPKKVKQGKHAKDKVAKGAKEVSKWLTHAQEFKIFNPDPEHVVAVRQSLFEDVYRIASCVATLQVGIPLAAERGKKYIPEHTLALSTELSCDAFPIVELSLEQAISYLRRESIVLPPEVPRGYVVVAFEGTRLGFVNNLGNRANNMYPNEWRIRH